MKTNAYPTHTCFDDTNPIIETLMDLFPKSIELMYIVHGVAAGRVHAWCEYDSDVYTMVMIDEERTIISIEKEYFYKDAKVTEATRYGLRGIAKRARANPNMKTGPWKSKYIKMMKEQHK